MSNYAENIINILAGLPEFLRKPILKHRLEEFFIMSKEEKEEIIENVLKTIPEIDPSILDKLIITWLDVLNQFDEERIVEIFSLYTFMISDKYINNINMTLLTDIFNRFEGKMRDNIIRYIRRSIERLDDDRKSKLSSIILSDVKPLIGL